METLLKVALTDEISVIVFVPLNQISLVSES